jgi:hypothetical protein
LRVRLRVPVRVDEDDAVGPRQVDAHLRRFTVSREGVRGGGGSRK